MTTAVSEAPAPARDFDQDFADILHLLVGACSGRVQVEARSQRGLAAPTRFVLDLPFEFVPPAVFNRSYGVNTEEIRVGLVSSADEVGAVVALFEMPLAFSAKTNWVYVPSVAGVDAVADALARFPLRPSALVDALAEVLVVWSLSAPVAANIAQPVMHRLAERLGSRPIDLGTSAVPVGGIVRTDGGPLPPVMVYEAVERDRRYDLETIAHAIEKVGRS